MKSRAADTDKKKTNEVPQSVKEAEDPRLEAARTRLRESRDRADALEGMREIVTNLLGCEEIGLYAVEQGKSSLLWSFGIDSQQHATLEAFKGPALSRVSRGEFHVVQLTRQSPDHEDPFVQVLVPICRSGCTIAVIAMFKLLPQKAGFDESDLKLVKVLSDETGRALFGRTMSTHA